ncbi:nucleotide-binding alpha-beta plait domain-containing protein [Tanacetum coccineum]
MGTFRSKEDDVQQISTSVFVTNFPDQFSAKDLWNTCKQYGYVVDAFIPNRKSKAGKRFGLVRFIKIFDVDRLVNNLCTVNTLRSLSNRKVILVNEGFNNIDLKYMGGYWVMIKFQSKEAKKTFQSNVDKGCGDVEIVNKRANVVRSLQELENLQSLEAAQKSKIKWAIEGDENSKYYHGIPRIKKEVS